METAEKQDIQDDTEWQVDSFGNSHRVYGGWNCNQRYLDPKGGASHWWLWKSDLPGIVLGGETDTRDEARQHCEDAVDRAMERAEQGASLRQAVFEERLTRLIQEWRIAPGLGDKELATGLRRISDEIEAAG